MGHQEVYLRTRDIEMPTEPERFILAELKGAVDEMLETAAALQLTRGVALAVSWRARQKPEIAAGALNGQLDRDSRHGDTGTNYWGIANGKLAYMMSTFEDSGSGSRDLKNGESGYKGGLYRKVGDIHVFTVYSGAPTEMVDVVIAGAGLKKLGIEPSDPVEKSTFEA